MQGPGVSRTHQLRVRRVARQRAADPHPYAKAASLKKNATSFWSVDLNTTFDMRMRMRVVTRMVLISFSHHCSEISCRTSSGKLVRRHCPSIRLSFPRASGKALLTADQVYLVGDTDIARLHQQRNASPYSFGPPCDPSRPGTAWP
jgi:hypothetical protein